MAIFKSDHAHLAASSGLVYAKEDDGEIFSDHTDIRPTIMSLPA